MSRGVPLPIRAMGDRIVEAVRRTGRLVLTAETGSGKSTQVPPMLLESDAVEGCVIVLEPRRLAARLLARRVAEEMGSEPGRLVGWQTRFERAWSGSTRIGFVTEGVFVRQWMSDPSLRGIGAVVLDEFHERSILADLSLGLVRRSQSTTRPDLRLIVMSATLDAETLAPALGAERLHAEGRRHPVEVRHRAAEPGAAPWQMAALALDELLDAGRAEGDALVFMPGAFEVDRTVETISAQLRRRGERAFVAGLHGAMSPQRQDEALRTRPERRVIVATNVAQTSITIDGVATVIDSGTARIHRHDPRRAIDALVLEPISRAAADQRAGRAGRTAPGCCVRLWSEQDHARRPDFDEPEIRRADLTEALLTIAAALPDGWDEIARFPWVDAPGEEHVLQARRVLARLGCLDERGAVTGIGRLVAVLPLHPRLGRAMIEATALERAPREQPAPREADGARGSAPGAPAVSAIDRTAAWCAVAAARDFVEERDPVRLRSLLERGDAPSDLVVRERLLEENRGARGSSIAVNAAAVAEARRARDQIRRAAGGEGRGGGAVGAGGRLPRPPAATPLEAATRALIAGFPEFVAWKPDRDRPNAFVAGRRKVEIDRDSLVREPGFVLALEVRADPRDPSTQRLSMLTPIDREWLEASCPERFRRVEEERWNPASRAVEAIEELRFDDVVIERVARPARRPAAAILAERIASGEIRLAQWDERVEQWIERVRCVAEWFPQRSLIRYDEEDLAVIRAEIAAGAVRAGEVEGRPCLDAVRSALSHEDARFVDRMAPAEIPLPNGRRMRLRYQVGRPPRGAARIQDLFDWRETPTVAGGTVAVLLEILAPSQRPLQVTSDLKGFFERLYPQIKPELKRRYPKHEWR